MVGRSRPAEDADDQSKNIVYYVSLYIKNNIGAVKIFTFSESMLKKKPYQFLLATAIFCGPSSAFLLLFDAIGFVFLHTGKI